MSELRVTRRVRWLRSDAAGMTRSDVTVDAAFSAHRGEARLSPTRMEGRPGLHDLVRRARERQPPASPADGLVVEAGLVEESLHCNGVGTAYRSPYVLVIRRGTVAYLARTVPTAPASDERRHVRFADVAADAPVVLAPSAVLALVQHWRETKADTAIPGAIPTLCVDDAAPSPYPPHDSRLRRAGEGVATVRAATATLLRPELWGRPFGALVADAVWGLSVHVPGELQPVPQRALVIDSVMPLPTARGQRWEGHVSVLDGASISPFPDRIHLAVGAGEALWGSRRPIGPARPALVRDAISGNRFGMAPSLLTELRTSALQLEPV